MFKKIVLTLAGFVLLASCGTMHLAKTGSLHEDIEWTHTWITHTNDTDLPHVLVIGDSHVEAYYPSVEKALDGIAYSAKLTTSKSMGDPMLLEQIAEVLKHYRFKVISFNNGLHGSGYSPEQYAAYIPKVYKLLRQYGNPQIQWVNTTAERNPRNLKSVDSFNLNIEKRNHYVAEFAGREHIPVIDLYALSIAHPEFYKNDGVHFKAAGVSAESHSVVQGILTLLKK